MNEFVSFFTNILNFSGRASRKEFIIPLVVILILSMVLGGVIGGVLGTLPSPIVFISPSSFSFSRPHRTPLSHTPFIPPPSISVRRLHDCGHSGLWVLLYLIPLVNLILIIYLCVKPGK